MKIVKVTYRAKPQYVEHNKANIQAVMAELRKIGNPGINYTCCLSSDGITFIHTSFFDSEESEKVLLELPAFIHFQDELKASGLETPPERVLPTLVGSSVDIFKS